MNISHEEKCKIEYEMFLKDIFNSFTNNKLTIKKDFIPVKQEKCKHDNKTYICCGNGCKCCKECYDANYTSNNKNSEEWFLCYYENILDKICYNIYSMDNCDYMQENEVIFDYNLDSFFKLDKNRQMSILANTICHNKKIFKFRDLYTCNVIDNWIECFMTYPVRHCLQCYKLFHIESISSINQLINDCSQYKYHEYINVCKNCPTRYEDEKNNINNLRYMITDFNDVSLLYSHYTNYIYCRDCSVYNITYTNDDFETITHNNKHKNCILINNKLFTYNKFIFLFNKTDIYKQFDDITYELKNQMQIFTIDSKNKLDIYIYGNIVKENIEINIPRVLTNNQLQINFSKLIQFNIIISQQESEINFNIKENYFSCKITLSNKLLISTTDFITSEQIINNSEFFKERKNITCVENNNEIKFNISRDGIPYIFYDMNKVSIDILDKSNIKIYEVDEPIDYELSVKHIASNHEYLINIPNIIREKNVKIKLNKIDNVFRYDNKKECYFHYHTKEKCYKNYTNNTLKSVRYVEIFTEESLNKYIELLNTKKSGKFSKEYVKDGINKINEIELTEYNYMFFIHEWFNMTINMTTDIITTDKNKIDDNIIETIIYYIYFIIEAYYSKKPDDILESL
jgi:hypothetical protein